MLPVLEGVIARRILLNFRCDPAVAQKQLPSPLQVENHNGFAIVGICLIRLEKLRPKGLPAIVGLSSENMAHRIAIRYPSDTGERSGVFIWRRDTDQKIVQMLGGRAFPGPHGSAEFSVNDAGPEVEMTIKTGRSEADVDFSAKLSSEWSSTSAFQNFRDASEFFRKGDCGFSCSMNGENLEGLQLKTVAWDMTALRVNNVRSAFFEDESRFPHGSVTFDCGLVMRGISHEWHELQDIPELATA
jgi:uncharacterized protein DUF2071